MRFRNVLDIFSSRNYRLYFAGQLVSLIGTWMTQTATVWLVYEMTHSAFWLGCISFVSQAPVVLLGPLAGVWVDRLDRVKLLILTQTLSMIQSFLLAWFTLSGHMTITILALLAVFQGMINALDLPTRQSLTVMLAEKREHLAGIIGMNSSMFNLGRLSGPAVAGFVIAAYGAGYCFLIDAISFLAVLTAIFAMRFTNQPAHATRKSVWREMREGFRYTFTSKPIRFLMAITSGMAIFGLSFAVLIPVYSDQIFHGTARTLGILMSSSAAGSVISALYLASRRGIKGIGRAIVIACTLAGTALLVFAFSTSLPLSMFCLMFVGMGGVLVIAASNSLVQNMVDEDKRGRVMSLFGISFLGGMPLGSLLTGSVAHSIGISYATCINAAACFLIAFLFYRHLPKFRIDARPALERTGVLQPILTQEPTAENLAS